MKKTVMGFSLLLASIGVVFAAQASTPSANTPAATATTPSQTMTASQKKLAANNIIINTPRIQVTPNNNNSAEVLMQLNNKSPQSITLIAANSMTADQTLLQKIMKRDHQQLARNVDKITIRPHGATQLQTDGTYIALNGLKQNLQKGDSVPLLLIFEDGSSTMVHATVN